MSPVLRYSVLAFLHLVLVLQSFSHLSTVYYLNVKLQSSKRLSDVVQCTQATVGCVRLLGDTQSSACLSLSSVSSTLLDLSCEYEVNNVECGEVQSCYLQLFLRKNQINKSQKFCKYCLPVNGLPFNESTNSYMNTILSTVYTVSGTTNCRILEKSFKRVSGTV